MQPRLAALLAHHAARSPRRQRIIETFVGRADGLLAGERDASVVEACQIALPIVGGRRHDPGIAAIAQHVAEPTIVLKKKQRLRGERGAHSGPVDGVHEINIEVCDYRAPLLLHVRRRDEVLLLDILQFTDQCLLRRTSGTGGLSNGTLVDHDRKRESGMGLGFCHDEFRRLVLVIIWTIPIDDDAIDTATDHVGDLAVDLCCIGGTVADIHVVRPAEPNHEMSVDLGACARIEQRVNVDLAHVGGAGIAIGLADKAVGCASIVRRLGGESG